MLNLLRYNLLLAAILLASSCSKQSFYTEKLKTLDSLEAVVGVVVSELQKADTLSLSKAIELFNCYRFYIEQNLNDTLTKSEADCVQQFFLAGKNLQHYSINRAQLLKHLYLQNAQLSALNMDVRNKALEEEVVTRNLNTERQQVSIVFNLASKQKQQFYSNLEKFKGSLVGIEGLIKQRNKGLMPTLVKDSLATTIP